MSPRTRLRLAMVIAAVTVMALIAPIQSGPAALAEEPEADAEPTRSTVFTRGEAGYHTFRIPALVQATDGTLLAFAEAKPEDPDDWGPQDIVLKRSTDGGATWGPIQLIAADLDGGGRRWSNAVPVVDRTTGRIVLQTHESDDDIDGADLECGRAELRTMIQHSDDHGATWSDRVDTTDQVKPDNYRTFSHGPGHGIQLTQGEHAGRLIIPGRHSYVPSDRVSHAPTSVARADTSCTATTAARPGTSVRSTNRATRTSAPTRSLRSSWPMAGCTSAPATRERVPDFGSTPPAVTAGRPSTSRTTR